MRALVLVVALAGCDRVFGLESTDAQVGNGDALRVGAGLVAYYPMDELRPTAAACAPEVIAQRDGNCTDGMPTVVDGHLGKAYSFVPTRDIRVNADGALDPAHFSVATWIRFHAAPDKSVCPINRGSGPGADNVWQICFDSARIVYWVGKMQFPVNQTFVADTWYHLALTFDGTMLTGYLDGTLLASGAAILLPYDNDPMTLGADLDNGSADNPIDADLDDVRLYDRPLTTMEVTSLATE